MHLVRSVALFRDGHFGPVIPCILEGNNVMPILWNSGGYACLGRGTFITILVGKVKGIFDPLIRYELRVCPSAVHVLTAELLWCAHADE